MKSFLRSALVAGVLALSVGSASAFTAQIPDDGTYDFFGACTDCPIIPYATGTLVVSNHAFQSWQYSSSLVSYSVDNTQISFFSGDITSVPGPYNVTIDSNFINGLQYLFMTMDDGNWSLFVNGNNTDTGTGGIWTAASTATPIPGALPMFISGLAGLGLLARRRRKQAA